MLSQSQVFTGTGSSNFNQSVNCNRRRSGRSGHAAGHCSHRIKVHCDRLPVVTRILSSTVNGQIDRDLRACQWRLQGLRRVPVCRDAADGHGPSHAGDGRHGDGALAGASPDSESQAIAGPVPVSVRIHLSRDSHGPLNRLARMIDSSRACGSHDSDSVRAGLPEVKTRPLLRRKKNEELQRSHHVRSSESFMHRLIFFGWDPGHFFLKLMPWKWK
jgi:hypothetical protein